MPIPGWITNSKNTGSIFQKRFQWFTVKLKHLPCLSIDFLYIYKVFKINASALFSILCLCRQFMLFQFQVKWQKKYALPLHRQEEFLWGCVSLGCCSINSIWVVRNPSDSIGHQHVLQLTRAYWLQQSIKINKAVSQSKDREITSC